MRSARNAAGVVLALGLLCAGGCLAAGAPAATLLVLEKGTLSLALVDPVTLKVLARVPSGPDPHEVVASSDATRAYISNYGGDGSDLHILSVVDLVARKALAPVDLGPLHSAHGLDVAGGKVYFTAETNKAIGRYDPATQRVDWVLGTGLDRTHMVLVTPDPAHILTSNVGAGSISFLDQVEQPAFGPPPPATAGAAASSPPPPPPPPRKVWKITSVPAGRGAEGFDLSPDGTQVWAANSRDATVTVIDVASRQAVGTFPIPVAGANRVKFTRDGKYALVSGLGMFGPGASPSPQAANLVVIDVATHAIVKTLALGGGSAGILMDPQGTRAYVAVSQGNKVAVIDLRSLQVTGEIAPLSQPDGLAWAQGR